MGIDIDGGMIVGDDLTDLSLNVQERVLELIDNREMDYLSPYYDSDREDWTVGYRQPDVMIVDDTIVGWLVKVSEDADRFEEITGTKAKLIGMQHVW